MSQTRQPLKAGKLAAYSGVAVAGLVGTRFVADITARGIKKPFPLFGTLLGTWGLATWTVTRQKSLSERPYVTAALIGSGIAVLEEGLSHVLPTVGLGPPSTEFPKPSLFNPIPRETKDLNFWRGRWVGCRRPDGTIERRWCHDSYQGQNCCPPGTKYEGMDEWPTDPTRIKRLATTSMGDSGFLPEIPTTKYRRSIMTGEQLWEIYLGAKVPDRELYAIGESIGHKKEVASGPAQSGLLKVCLFAAQQAGGTIVFSPSQLFQALKMWMPGGNPLTIKQVRTTLLENIALDYKHAKPYASTQTDVREYIAHVAEQLPSIVIIPPPNPPTTNPPAQSVMGGTEIGATNSAPPNPPTGAPPKNLQREEYEWMCSTVSRLAKEPTKVTDNHLAGARNLAARGNMTSLVGQLDNVIVMRGAADSTEESSPLKRTAPFKKKPIWPFLVGAGLLVAWMSKVSHQGHREISARIERERAFKKLAAA